MGTPPTLWFIERLMQSSMLCQPTACKPDQPESGLSGPHLHLFYLEQTRLRPLRTRYGNRGSNASPCPEDQTSIRIGTLNACDSLCEE